MGYVCSTKNRNNSKSENKYENTVKNESNSIEAFPEIKGVENDTKIFNSNKVQNNNNDNITFQEQNKEKKLKNMSLSDKKKGKKGENKSLSFFEQDEIKFNDTISSKIKEKIKESKNNFNLQNEEIKDINKTKFDKEKEKLKNKAIEFIDIIQNSKKSDNSSLKIKNDDNFINYHNGMDSFLSIEGEPLKKYDYFKIDFTKCNYIFIVPQQFSEIFSSFYSNNLKNSIIFFPKDYPQALELLNDIKEEEGTKDNWIMICYCKELEKYINILNKNKNVYLIVVYCPFSEHNHDFDFFFKFSKFYDIVYSYNKLIEILFKFNNIYYFRKKQNYDIDYKINDNNNTIDLKYDTSILIDYNNDCSKKNVIIDKFRSNYAYKRNNGDIYFSFIQLYTFLKKCIDDAKFDLLYIMFENLSDKFVVQKDLLEKTLTSTNLLLDLLTLYLYFSNYPYLYGALSDFEIDKILSRFKRDMSREELYLIFASGYNCIIVFTEGLVSQINRGESILNNTLKLKILQKMLIEQILSNAQLFGKINIAELIKFYQIKNYLRDIDFCLGKFIIDIIQNNNCENYLSQFKITPNIYNKERRYIAYLNYTIQAAKQNDIENNQAKAYNLAIKFNHTIVLGDNLFHNLIKKINIPCGNIYFLNENQFSNFFLVPKKIENKYKVCKYFIIMNEKYIIKYMETIRYISNVLGLKFAVIYISKIKILKFIKK